MCIVTHINVGCLGLQRSFNYIVVLAVLEGAGSVQHQVCICYDSLQKNSAVSY